MKRRRTRTLSRAVRRRTAPQAAWLAATIAALSISPARAQEALLNSLAYDRAVQPRQNPAVDLGPGQPHLGPVALSLGLYANADFEDNINYAETGAQSDEILHAGLNAGLFWPLTPQSDLSLNTSIGYGHYVRNSQLDSLEVGPNSALNWNILFEDGSLAFYDQFSYSQQVVTEAALSDTSRFPRFDNTVGTRATWQPGHWQLEAGYSHENYFTDSAALQYLDHSAENVFARGAWRFAENTQAGLEASGGLTSYSVSTQSGNYNLSLGPFADWQVTQAIHASLRGGPTLYVFDSQGGSSQGSQLISYYVSLEIRHQLTDHFSHQVSVSRSISPGVNQGGDYTEDLTASYSFSWSLLPQVGLSVAAGYDHGTQTFQNLVPLAPGLGLLQNQTENYDRYNVGPTLSWQAARKLATSLSYNHYLRESNLAARGYTANSLTLSVNYSF